MKTSDVVLWVIGALFALVTLFGGRAFSSVTDDVEALKLTDSTKLERITKLETRVDAYKEQLDRIEQKLDRLLEKTTDAR